MVAFPMVPAGFKNALIAHVPRIDGTCLAAAVRYSVKTGFMFRKQAREGASSWQP
jgi:hypothetical protein